MKERIKEFIDKKGMQPSELAVMLDVQRSNVSHILNGRNKPGASFIEKMLLVFPELNARWLLTGEGSMFIVSDSIVQPTIPEVKKAAPEKPIELEIPFKNKQTTGQTERTEHTELTESKKQTENKKTIEKVILLYNDGSFSAFDEAVSGIKKD